MLTDISKIVSATFCKKLKGNIRFDLGEISHPAFGTVEIIGEFPRIIPRVERQNVTPSELEIMKSYLQPWVTNFFEGNVKPKVLSGMIECVSLFVAYVYPSAIIKSAKTELALKFHYWLWIADNILELSFGHKNGLAKAASLQNGCNQLVELLGNNQKNLVPVEDFPSLGPLFYSLQDLISSLREYNPKYSKNMPPFHFLLQRYFGSMNLYIISPIDGSYSEEVFKNWRDIVAYFDGCAASIWMIEGDFLPPEIHDSPSFRRILDIMNSLSALTNDLLGMRKEFGNNEVDNIVVFKVIEKKIPIYEAVEQVCAQIKQDLIEYLHLRDLTLKIFSYHPSLLKYFDILEPYIDGHNRFYTQSKRHLTVGCVEIIN